MKLIEKLKVADKQYVVYAIYVAVVVIFFGLSGDIKSAINKVTMDVSEIRKPLPIIKLEKHALTRAEYAEIVDHMSVIHPDLKIELFTPTGIEIYTNEESKFHPWKAALLDLMSSKKAVYWQFTSLCAGKTCGAYPFKTVVTAYRQQTSVSE